MLVKLDLVKMGIQVSSTKSICLFFDHVCTIIFHYKEDKRQRGGIYKQKGLKKNFEWKF